MSFQLGVSKWRWLLSFFLVFLATSELRRSLASAGEEVTLEMTSSVPELPRAKREMIDQAIERVTADHAQRILGIGAGGSQSAKKLDLSRLRKNSSKYILTISNGVAKRLGNKWQMPVTLRISTDQLREILLAENRQAGAKGHPQVLPVIRWVFHTDKSPVISSWWVPPKPGMPSWLGELDGILEQGLRDAFWDNGFALMQPRKARLTGLLPPAYQYEVLQRSDLAFISSFFKSPILVQGQVRLRPSQNNPGAHRMEFFLQAIQGRSGRVIAEVERAVDSEVGDPNRVLATVVKTAVPKIGQDLALQLADSWRAGTLDAVTFRLVVLGRLSYRELTWLKENLIARVPEIKSIRERLFESNQVTFEVDTPQTPQALSEAIRRQRFDRLKIQIQDVRADALVLAAVRN